MESNETVKKTRKRVPAAAQRKSAAVVEAKNKPVQKEKSSLLTFLAIVAASLIVGGIVYSWQKSTGEKKVNQAKQEADSIKIDFENRLSGLKDKLTGVESENNSLKTTNEDLKNKADLLAEAKMEYSSPELGINFEYPASFGEVKLTVSNGETGKAFKGVFSNNDKLFFGGVTADYSKTATSTEAEFTDTLGYEKKKNVYYYKYAAEKNKSVEYKINPVNAVKTKNGEALIVDKKSFAGAQEKPQINIGENIGAVVNLKKGGFTGMAFVDQDLGLFPLINFGAMLESIEVN